MRLAANSSRTVARMEHGPCRADRGAKPASISSVRFIDGAGQGKADRPGTYPSTTADAA